MSRGKDKGKHGTRSSVSKVLAQGDDPSNAEAAERDVLFKLSFLESLGDPQVSTKLQKIMKLANKDLLETLGSLRDEVRSLKQQLADRDSTIAGMKQEIQELRDHNDALEQYGRRNCLRISGISDTEENRSRHQIGKRSFKGWPPITGAPHQREPSTAQAPQCPTCPSTPHHRPFQQENRSRPLY